MRSHCIRVKPDAIKGKPRRKLEPRDRDTELQDNDAIRDGVEVLHIEAKESQGWLTTVRSSEKAEEQAILRACRGLCIDSKAQNCWKSLCLWKYHDCRQKKQIIFPIFGNSLRYFLFMCVDSTYLCK